MGEMLFKIAVISKQVASGLSIKPETQAMETMLDRLTSHIQTQLHDRTDTLRTTLEPLMVIIVGSLVGFIVFSMYLPIFKIAALV
jgi:type IV pilus assembly protein PilC